MRTESGKRKKAAKSLDTILAGVLTPSATAKEILTAAIHIEDMPGRLLRPRLSAIASPTKATSAYSGTLQITCQSVIPVMPFSARRLKVDSEIDEALRDALRRIDELLAMLKASSTGISTSQRKRKHKPIDPEPAD